MSHQNLGKHLPIIHLKQHRKVDTRQEVHLFLPKTSLPVQHKVLPFFFLSSLTNCLFMKPLFMNVHRRDVTVG